MYFKWYMRIFREYTSNRHNIIYILHRLGRKKVRLLCGEIQCTVRGSHFFYGHYFVNTGSKELTRVIISYEIYETSLRQVS